MVSKPNLRRQQDTRETSANIVTEEVSTVTQAAEETRHGSELQDDNAQSQTEIINDTECQQSQSKSDVLLLEEQTADTEQNERKNQISNYESNNLSDIKTDAERELLVQVCMTSA
jgi:hypothetical protein